jgi:hypothetical protein
MENEGMGIEKERGRDGNYGLRTTSLQNPCHHHHPTKKRTSRNSIKTDWITLKLSGVWYKRANIQARQCKARQHSVSTLKKDRLGT